MRISVSAPLTSDVMDTTFASAAFVDASRLFTFCSLPFMEVSVSCSLTSPAFASSLIRSSIDFVSEILVFTSSKRLFATTVLFCTFCSDADAFDALSAAAFACFSASCACALAATSPKLPSVFICSYMFLTSSRIEEISLVFVMLSSSSFR